MRNSFRRFSAIAAGLALSLTLSAPAYAATLNNGGVYEGNANSITINKAVVIANEEGSAASGLTVAYPDMSFGYSVSPYTITGKTVKDANGDIAEVKAGLAAALTASNSSISIASGSVVLNANGQQAVNGAITFTVDVDAYKNAGYGAGVYRYEITESSDKDALAAKGVVRAATNKVYYLDVYLKNTSTGGLEPGGFVLSDDDDDITPTDNDKQGGFDDVPVDPTPGEDPTDPTNDPRDDYQLTGAVTDLSVNDHYLTYNVTLNKVVAGVMGDKTHGFAFTATLDNKGLDYQYEVTGNDAVSLNKALDSASDSSVNVALSNNGTLKIWGLSPLATVNYSENNNTDSVYKTKIDTAAGTVVKAEADLVAGADLAAYATAQNVTNSLADTAHNAAADVVYTNTLNDISPTGVVLRFAPYIAMLGASMILLLAFKSNKAYEEE